MSHPQYCTWCAHARRCCCGRSAWLLLAGRWYMEQVVPPWRPRAALQPTPLTAQAPMELHPPVAFPRRAKRQDSPICKKPGRSSRPRCAGTRSPRPRSAQGPAVKRPSADSHATCTAHRAAFNRRCGGSANLCRPASIAAFVLALRQATPALLLLCCLHFLQHPHGPVA